jgi:hypothetical protein
MPVYRVHFSIFHDIEASDEKEALAAAVAKHPESQFLAFESCELISFKGKGFAIAYPVPLDEQTQRQLKAMVLVAQKMNGGGNE